VSTEELYWEARELGIASEAQFLAFAQAEGYKPIYFGGNNASKDVEITRDGVTSTVDVKTGFLWDDGKVGFMGRDPKKGGLQIRADYLGLVVHNDGRNAKLFGDRLVFPEHKGIYLVQSAAVEDLFVRGLRKNDGVTPTGMNVYAHLAALEEYRVR
jgi:hypothetical protein